MKNHPLAIVPLVLLFTAAVAAQSNFQLHLTQHDVLEAHGLSVLLFHNAYHRVFGDQKMNGLEIILHGRRIATGGDVRLSPTPEQGSHPRFQRTQARIGTRRSDGALLV